MTTNKHIGCSTDDHYLPHCAAMLCSLLENSKSTYTVHILYNHEKLNPDGKELLASMVQKYRSEIIFHDVDEKPLQGVQFRKNRPLTCAAYYRILLSSLLDQSIEKVLYLDCDIIVLQDVAPVFDLEIDDYALAAVQDLTNPCDLQRMQMSIPYEECFFCSGVMLINLKYWREHHSEKKLLEYSKKKRVVFLHDQDALNAVFYHAWFKLPPKWNKFNMQTPSASFFLTESDRMEFIKSPVLIHYLIKPWLGLSFVRYTKEYKAYLEKAGFSYGHPTFQGNKVKMYSQIILTNFRIACEENDLAWVYHVFSLFIKAACLVKKIISAPFSWIKPSH